MKHKGFTPGFSITSHKGFHISLPNGYTLSVQFGGGNYCANYDTKIGTERDVRRLDSPNAEIAVWDAEDNWIKVADGDNVRGYVTPAGVVAALGVLARAKTNRGLAARIRAAIAKATGDAP